MSKESLPLTITQRVELECRPGLWVEIRQARAGDVLQRAQLLKKGRYRYRTDEVVAEDIVRPEELAKLEMWLTFVDSNIVLEDGRALKKGISQQEFEAIWDELPLDIVSEWYEAVLELTPTWGFDSLGG